MGAPDCAYWEADALCKSVAEGLSTQHAGTYPVLVPMPGGAALRVHVCRAALSVVQGFAESLERGVEPVCDECGTPLVRVDAGWRHKDPVMSVHGRGPHVARLAERVGT